MAPAVLLSAIASLLHTFWGDRRGNIAIMTALAMPVLIGSTGLAVEVGFWYHQMQAMQSAADSAAVAAATAAGTSYDEEARGVAAKYGLTHGQSNVSVETLSGVACPAAPAGVVYSGCYQVTITSLVPLFLSSVVGYRGNATATEDGKSVAKTKLVASAVAARTNTPREYCVVTLGQADVTVDLDLNGTPKADLKNCGMMSNEGMVCSGNAREVASFADSPTGDSSPCGLKAHSMPAPKQTDPYAKLAANIPSQPCYNYLGELLLTAPVFTNPNSPEVTYCGNVKLMKNITINTPTVMVIKNGNLDLNGFTLTGSALTIIFTGDNGTSSHVIDGKGTLNITAPTSGDWKGVALYQDPALTKNVNFTAAGSTQTINVDGLFYFPNAEVTLSGAVNKDVNPVPCLMMMVGSLRVNGGGFFADSDKCTGKLNLPSWQRGRLVS
jgi:type II secretory pathway pseudopilin PulG